MNPFLYFTTAVVGIAVALLLVAGLALALFALLDGVAEMARDWWRRRGGFDSHADQAIALTRPRTRRARAAQVDDAIAGFRADYATFRTRHVLPGEDR